MCGASATSTIYKDGVRFYPLLCLFQNINSSSCELDLKHIWTYVCEEAMNLFTQKYNYKYLYFGTNVLMIKFDKTGEIG
jgi:hypothetical protein